MCFLQYLSGVLEKLNFYYICKSVCSKIKYLLPALTSTSMSTYRMCTPRRRETPRVSRSYLPRKRRKQEQRANVRLTHSRCRCRAFHPRPLCSVGPYRAFDVTPLRQLIIMSLVNYDFFYQTYRQTE